MTGIRPSVLPPAEKEGNKINMASGQQWVLVEMVQAFYEVRTLFFISEKFGAQNSASPSSSTDNLTSAVHETAKLRKATANFSIWK